MKFVLFSEINQTINFTINQYFYSNESHFHYLIQEIDVRQVAERKIKATKKMKEFFLRQEFLWIFFVHIFILYLLFEFLIINQ